MADELLSAPTCFVIMPFGGNYDRYYRNIYVPAIQKAGFAPVRGDSIFGAGMIMEDIWRSTQSSTVVLADVTGRNPNVFYELGLAHAAGKPVVIVSNNLEDIPFDIRHIRHVPYDKDDENWGATLQDRIGEALKETERDPLRGLSMFLRPIGPAAKDLSERQRAVVGFWTGRGQDIYVETAKDKVAFDLNFEFSFNQSQILGTVEVIPLNVNGSESVKLSLNGEFYNDDLFEMIYRSRVRKQYGAMVVRISDEPNILDGHYAGFSPTRGCFIMGDFKVTRHKI